MFAPGGFVWLLGVEDTCVYPPPRYGMPPLDEFALTGHDAVWRDDLRLAADLGATGLRYGVGWPRVHPAPGRFDWSQLDERVALATDLGLELVADLVHYGTPTWLDGSFADAGFPDAMAEYAGAFAERYRGVVDAITPLNEPVTTASFAGLRGVWPPALHGWDGWVRVTVGIARGVQQAISAIRAANPEATIVHVEASGLHETADPALEEHVDLLRMTSTLPTDLILGRVGDGDRSWRWLVEQGADAGALAGLAAAPPSVDILGLNYYPDLTPRVVVRGDDGPRQLAVDRGAAGLERVLIDARDRWALPIVVTETSIEGDEAARTAWLRDAAGTVDRMRDAGHDIRGLTWWPLLDFVDWSWAAGGRNVEEFAIPAELEADRAGGDAGLGPFLRRMGLVRLDAAPDGTLQRAPDGSAELFARLTGARSPVL